MECLSTSGNYVFRSFVDKQMLIHLKNLKEEESDYGVYLNNKFLRIFLKELDFSANI